MMNWKGFGSKLSWNNLKVLSRNWPAHTEENQEILGQDSRSPGRDRKRGKSVNYLNTAFGDTTWRWEVSLRPCYSSFEEVRGQFTSLLLFLWGGEKSVYVPVIFPLRRWEVSLRPCYSSSEEMRGQFTSLLLFLWGGEKSVYVPVIFPLRRWEVSLRSCYSSSEEMRGQFTSLLLFL
jgi:uncharacterized membrane protein